MVKADKNYVEGLTDEMREGLEELKNTVTTLDLNDFIRSRIGGSLLGTR